MPRSSRPGWIDWDGSAVQEILLNDFVNGGLLFNQTVKREKLLEEQQKMRDLMSYGPSNVDCLWKSIETDCIDYNIDILSDQQLFSIYKLKNSEDFQNVVFSQFTERLKGYRINAGQRLIKSRQQEADLNRYLQKFPPDETAWNNHVAKKLLKDLVKNGYHKEHSPEDIWSQIPTFRDNFDLDVFRGHIYQEIRYIKMVNHMNNERVRKQEIEKKQRAKEKKSKEKEEMAAKAREIKQREKEAARQMKQREKEVKEQAKETAAREGSSSSNETTRERTERTSEGNRSGCKRDQTAREGSNSPDETTRERKERTSGRNRSGCKRGDAARKTTRGTSTELVPKQAPKEGGMRRLARNQDDVVKSNR